MLIPRQTFASPLPAVVCFLSPASSPATSLLQGDQAATGGEITVLFVNPMRLVSGFAVAGAVDQAQLRVANNTRDGDFVKGLGREFFPSVVRP